MEIKENIDTCDSKFDINTWFNNMPIRIIWTPDGPFFYANDVGKVLRIAKIRNSVKDFDETEIVTPETRKKHNLVTYQKCGNKMRVNNKVILLTEFGVYRLIINSRSQLSKSFKSFIYNVLSEARKLNVAASGNVLSCENLTKGSNIYFITHMPFDNKVKIGISNNPSRRLKQLQTGNPHKLVIYHMIESENPHELEDTLHEICGDLKLDGGTEWFSLQQSELDALVGKYY